MKQPDLFRKPESGQAIKQRELERWQENESRWIARARAAMLELCLDRNGQPVSSDDVWDLCPPPADCHPSVMGPVFRGGLFQKVGWKASKRPSAHARMISIYTIKEV